MTVRRHLPEFDLYQYLLRASKENTLRGQLQHKRFQHCAISRDIGRSAACSIDGLGNGYLCTHLGAIGACRHR